MGKNDTVIICGNYGARNLGDEAVLDGILLEIKKYYPNLSPLVLSHDADDTFRMHKVPALPLLPMGIRSLIRGFKQGSISQTLTKIAQSKVFILGGGTLLSDEKLFAVFLWGMQLFWAYYYKIPVYIYANGIGPLNRPIGRWITKKILKKAIIITVRDKNSAQEIKKLAPEKEVTVTADPAFILGKYLNFDDNISEEPHNLNHTEKNLRYESEKFIIMSLRNWPGFSDSHISEIAHFINKTWHEKGIQTILVSLQEYREQDSEILNKIFNQVLNKKSIQIKKDFNNYIELISLMKDAILVIGMRLHSLIFATLTEKPFIALSYSNKVRDIVYDLNMSQQLIYLSEVTEKALFQKLEYTLNNLSKIKIALKNKKNEQEHLASENIKKLAEIMNKKYIHQ